MKDKKIIIFQIIVFIIGLILIETYLNLRNNNIQKVYETHKKIDYEVYLKPNDFYENQILESKGCYAAKSIDFLKINFEHQIIGVDNMDMEYKYKITNRLFATAVNGENVDNTIWERDYFVFESDIKNKNIGQNIITEDFDINYDFYRNLVNSYEEQYGIQVNAVLKVRLDVFYNIKSEKEKCLEDYIEFDIPVTDLVLEPQENYEENSLKNIIIQKDKYKIAKNVCFILGSIMILGDVILYAVKIYKFKLGSENKYEKKIRKILKYYKDDIVIINNELNLSEYKVLKIANFEDMINLAEQNQTNVIYYEAVKNEVSYMYVIVRDCVYFYKIAITDV